MVGNAFPLVNWIIASQHGYSKYSNCKEVSHKGTKAQRIQLVLSQFAKDGFHKLFSRIPNEILDRDEESY